MSTQTSLGLPFRCKQRMTALAGSSGLVRLEFRKLPCETALYAHAPYLMAASGVLRGLLIGLEETEEAGAVPKARERDASCSSTGEALSSIPLEEDSIAAWEMALCMLYPSPVLSKAGDSAVEDPKMLESLLLLGDKYDMPMLLEKCKVTIAQGLDSSTLTAESVFKWMPSLSKFQMQKHVNKCIDFITSNKLRVPKECLCGMDPGHLEQLYNSMQQTLQNELQQSQQQCIKDLSEVDCRLQAARTEAAGVQEKLNKFQLHHVHQRLPLKFVAFSRDHSHVVAWEEGRHRLSTRGCSIPTKFADEILAMRERGVRTEFASLGRGDAGEEVWFLRDSAGKTYLGSGVHEQLRDLCSKQTVVRVSFSPDGSFFATLKSGCSMWDRLPETAEATKSVHNVEHMAFGFKSEWVAQHCDGKDYTVQDVHPVLTHFLKNKQSLTGELEWVELGPDGTFVALFKNYTLWYGCEGLSNHLLCEQVQHNVQQPVQPLTSTAESDPSVSSGWSNPIFWSIMGPIITWALLIVAYCWK